MKNRFWILLMCFSTAVVAQSDSILTYDRFMAQISNYHPLSQKAGLMVASAKAAVLEAKGGFDPVLGLKKSDKNFTGIDYYDKNSASLTVPLPFGPNVYAGAERATGTYLNPEITSGTISYVGIDIPLLKGLWMDERRAALQTAKQYLGQSEQARLLAYNEVASAAAQAYWSWAEAFQMYQLTDNTLKLARQRMNLLRTLQTNGDRSEADTIEVFIQVSQLALMRDEQLTIFNNATINLTGFVWEEDLYDALLTQIYKPRAAAWQLPEETEIESWLLSNSIESIPALRWYDFKLAALGVEKKIKQQSLLPQLNVSTRVLSRSIYEFTGLDRLYFTENYALGINFKMPLLFREGRGGLQQTKIKILDTQLDRNLKLRDVTNKRTMLINELNLLNNQLVNIAQLIGSQNRLYNLELSKFNLGESSVFLVNAREQKLLELNGKQIELNAKRAKVLTKINELRAGFR